ncbi:MAG: bifunctional precorrin-2 dehydrogenase/sirohydrochlorin ferrochelatase [Desulfurococcales archaeon]|nr:bifunctional precorrin-2 dehydrogenase/sirohydrochlorin ferrochelatase [Desulfurococcales archaeon]MCE4621686.1 bifunctional precorrin-2 dehydrogenase/sirohydrochlorin ferrochelatase [Desulfurococcales archaeon]MCE4627368.1 bifunctional precorrin-2 dehydrogenase/sirohydrochlorin ferrochelatase [Desulfurococcales archaeon]MCE4629347.1 bifunctional precorrin-2 dehydrogenase/sirohydrochlorin ferrochelatase [Desulfurococcales archaeon]
MADEWIPLYIKPRGLKVAVFGGGSVATRRAKLFAEAGAEVTVYALEFSDQLKELSEQGLVRLREIDLSKADIESLINGASIIVIALNDLELSRRISSLALEKGMLVNNAVEVSRGNVIVPYRGKTSYGLYISTTSLGETGVGARRALERLLEVLERDPYYKTLFRAMAKVKKYLKENIADPKLRFKANLAADADEEVHRLAEKGLEAETYRRALRSALKAVEDADDPR